MYYNITTKLTTKNNNMKTLNFLEEVKIPSSIKRFAKTCISASGTTYYVHFLRYVFSDLSADWYQEGLTSENEIELSMLSAEEANVLEKEYLSNLIEDMAVTVYAESNEWWKSLSEKEKWNLTINHLVHHELMSNEQIYELYNENN